MKKSIIFLLLSCLSLSFIACERDEDKATIKDPVSPSVLSALSGTTFTLLMEEENEVFQTFNWSEADYGFDASVDYEVQVDVKDSSFSNPVTLSTVNNGTSSSITIKDFNKILLDIGIEPDAPTVLQFRIASFVSSHYSKAFSDPVEATVTPYATVFPPIYMVGAATGGWDWTKAVEVRSTAPSKYYTIAYFINNETFRFFKQFDWGPTSYNYPYFDGGFVTDSLINADDGDKNFKVVSPTGYYAVTVDIKNKIVDFDAVDEPQLFMTGAALGGWDWTTNYVTMTWLSHGIFEATTEFINGETFRFFAQADWGPTSYNFPYFPSGSVDDLFENAEDGDKNFKFVGTTGMYTITINFLDNTVIMEEAVGK